MLIIAIFILILSKNKNYINGSQIFSKVKIVITNSRNEAIKLGNDYIGLEHLVLGILREKECTAVKLLTYLGVDTDELKKRLNFQSLIKTLKMKY